MNYKLNSHSNLSGKAIIIVEVVQGASTQAIADDLFNSRRELFDNAREAVILLEEHGRVLDSMNFQVR